MYTLVHEGELKIKADVGSIGKSTLRRWLHAFSDAVVSRLKSKYMSGKPMSDRECAEVQGQFASRHGLGAGASVQKEGGQGRRAPALRARGARLI